MIERESIVGVMVKESGCHAYAGEKRLIAPEVCALYTDKLAFVVMVTAGIEREGKVGRTQKGGGVSDKIQSLWSSPQVDHVWRSHSCSCQVSQRFHCRNSRVLEKTCIVLSPAYFSETIHSYKPFPHAKDLYFPSQH